jgi:Ni,Fe-hydrogenase III small subunit
MDQEMMEIQRVKENQEVLKTHLEELGKRLSEKIGKIFGRSLHIREVDSGSCNACEWEITALSNPVYDLERFGIYFVASPRHADVLLVTGPVSRNLYTALLRTYEATPEPKLVIAVGTCACSGGLFHKGYASLGGVDKVLPVDIYIPGCPPRPQAILQGLLLAMDKLAQKIRKQNFSDLQGGDSCDHS